MKSIADASGDYVTGPNQSVPLMRTFPSPTFYFAFLRIVFHSSALARRGRYGNEEWWRSSFGVLKALEKVGAEIEITGLDTLDRVDGPCVIVSNHMSTLETIVLPGIVQPYKDCTFVVKRGIVEYPVFKHLMLARDPIVVDRVSPRNDLQRVLEGGTSALKSGRSIIVFPQTTRTLTFDPALFNTMGIKLARNARVPIIPVAVKSDAWGIGSIVKEFGWIDPSKKVHLAFGAPVHVTGRGADAHAAVVEFVSAKLRSWGAAVLDTAPIPDPATDAQPAS